MDASQFKYFLNNPYQTEDQVAATLLGNFFTARVPEDAVRGDYAVTKLPPNDLKLVPHSELPGVRTADEQSAPFEVSTLKVTPFDEIAASLHNLPSLVLDVMDGPQVMVTTQLSGCTLVYQRSTAADPVVRIIHIRPPFGEDARVVNEQIRQAAPRFAGQAVVAQTWGRENHGPANVNLIAVRLVQRWTLYAQLFHEPHKVAGVQRIPFYT